MTPLYRRKRPKDDLPLLVSSTLHGNEGRYPSLVRAAQHMCMSPRTLKRRLRAHGVSFRQLLDRARYSHATRLLADPELTVEQVAFQVGYSSLANFSRAFRRWAGSSPGAFRLRLEPIAPTMATNDVRMPVLTEDQRRQPAASPAAL